MRRPTWTSLTAPPLKVGSSSNVTSSTTRCACLRMPVLSGFGFSAVAPVNWVRSNDCTVPSMETSKRKSSQYGSGPGFPNLRWVSGSSPFHSWSSLSSASIINRRSSFSLLILVQAFVFVASYFQCQVSSFTTMNPFSTLGMLKSIQPLLPSISTPPRSSLCPYKMQSNFASLLQNESSVPSQNPDGNMETCPFPGFWVMVSSPVTVLS
mmetsp:Transcript_9563/g.26021  ORF Transcript_9563/g.26021 Transcript_9563/m.26021 type:complete len:209 (+) Transcript_9563:432-1058(+)